MATFPSDIPTFEDLVPGTLQANNHGARHNKVHAELEAVAIRVGATGSTDPTSHEKRITDAEDDLTDLENDVSVLPTLSEVTTLISDAIAAAKAALYPVGSIYSNAGVDTNPGTLLGFGTWIAWGQGRVPVGVDSSQTEFDSLEETGGAKTHTLSLAQIPNATGLLTIHGAEGGSIIYNVEGVFSTSTFFGSLYRTSSGSIGGAHSHSNVRFNLGGGGQAHNNLQPYITVYMWKRTA